MYDVTFWYKDGLEWDCGFMTKEAADFSACKYSLVEGVSEALVYDEDGHLVGVWVNGEAVAVEEYERQAVALCEIDNEYDEPIDPLDECGYDPYGGCFDMDL
jgi:hypothetical protein